MDSINTERSYTEYEVTAPTTDFAIGFDNYSGEDKDAIHVTLDGVNLDNLDYTVVRKNAQVIEVTPAIESGVVRLQRETYIDQAFHTFTAGALFSPKSMDENFAQVRRSQQEVNDGFTFLAENTNGVVAAADAATARANAAAELAENTDVGQFLAQLDAQKLDTGITATAKFGGVARSQADVNSETVSLLDFGAPYSTDSSTHLQAALDYLDSVGGGTLKIPHHTGTLVISGAITPYANITVLCDPTLTVDCRGRTSGYSFDLRGTTEAEISIAANITSGSTTITTVSAHGYSVGDDVLIISQRECAHADAGDLWRLGETTAGVSSPFFAEPIKVSKINSSTSFDIQTGLIFPDYRTDKTLETSELARESSTVMKMNLASNFKWLGGHFLKDAGSLFHTMWTSNCFIDIQVTRGYGTGQEYSNRFSLANKSKLTCTRPADWVLEYEHSKYNSVKDVSSWYTEMWLDEENGSQGLDQTYTDYCGIMPTYHVRHTNSHEDAMTTHGCVYGAIMDVKAFNCKHSALRNRARFASGTVFASNCGSILRSSTWGVLDTEFTVYGVGCLTEGVSLASEGVTAIAPATKNTRISGLIYMAPTATGAAIFVTENLDAATLLKDSKISLVNLNIRSYGTRAISAGSYVNAVTIDNVHIEHYNTAPPVYLRLGSGHRIRNLTVDYKVPVADDIVAVFGSPLASAVDIAAYGNTAWSFDYESCKVSAGGLVTAHINIGASSMTYSGTSSTTDVQTISPQTSHSTIKINLVTGIDSENRLVLSKNIAIGRVYQVLLTSDDPANMLAVYRDPTGTDSLQFMGTVVGSGSRYIHGDVSKYFYIQRVSNTVINIYN